MRGFSLIELMIAVAILAIVTAIAIPAYQGYIREAKLGVARQNAESLRMFLEDYGLENSDYRVDGMSSLNTSQLASSSINWTPTGDQGKYTYQVTATTTSYNILVRYGGATPWLRCENRMNNCCDDETGASTNSCS